MLIFKLAGVEKNNDDARKILQRRSNHTDDPAEVLRAEHHVRTLKHRERKPRQYTKKNTKYRKHQRISRTFLLKIFVSNRGSGLSARTSGLCRKYE